MSPTCLVGHFSACSSSLCCSWAEQRWDGGRKLSRCSDLFPMLLDFGHPLPSFCSICQGAFLRGIGFWLQPRVGVVTGQCWDLKLEVPGLASLLKLSPMPYWGSGRYFSPWSNWCERGVGLPFLVVGAWTLPGTSSLRTYYRCNMEAAVIPCFSYGGFRCCVKVDGSFTKR